MEVGAAARMTGATKLNERSSRSHAVFILIVERSRAPGAPGGADDEMDQFRGLTPGTLPAAHHMCLCQVLQVPTAECKTACTVMLDCCGAMAALVFSMCSSRVSNAVSALPSAGQAEDMTQKECMSRARR